MAYSMIIKQPNLHHGIWANVTDWGVFVLLSPQRNGKDTARAPWLIVRQLWLYRVKEKARGQVAVYEKPYLSLKPFN